MKNIDSYVRLIVELDKHELKDDNASSHIVQDQIYRKFIVDICSGKLASLHEAREVAELLKNAVIAKDVGRWYA